MKKYHLKFKEGDKPAQMAENYHVEDINAFLKEHKVNLPNPQVVEGNELIFDISEGEVTRSGSATLTEII